MKLNYTEAEIVAGCQRQERKFQQLLFDKFYKRMYSVCTRYVNTNFEAEDVVLNGFMKAFSNISKFQGGSLEGWVRRIMVNEALQQLRNTKLFTTSMEVFETLPEPDYGRHDDHLEAEDLMNMLHQLPAGYRTVFNLFAIEGFNHAEIAQMLGISENTSKSQLSRARALLQKMLIEREPAYSTREV